MRDCTIFCAKKHCRKSLTGICPSCGSNVNCKLQTWPQGRRHVCGLRFSMKNLMLKVSNMRNNPRVITNGKFFFYLFISVSRPKKQRIKEQLALYELILLRFFLSKTPKFIRNFIILDKIPFKDAPIKHLLNASRFLHRILFCLHRNWQS